MSSKGEGYLSLEAKNFVLENTGEKREKWPLSLFFNFSISGIDEAVSEVTFWSLGPSASCSSVENVHTAQPWQKLFQPKLKL